MVFIITILENSAIDILTAFMDLKPILVRNIKK